MQRITDNLEAHAKFSQTVMTSSEEAQMNTFLRIVERTDELPDFVDTLTSDLDVFVKIIRDEVGLNRVMRLLGISDDINTFLFYPIMMRFSEIMTHERGYDLMSRVLDVCNIHEKKMFCHITYRNVVVLERDENGCNILKKVITIANDILKEEFLNQIAYDAPSLSMEAVGISLIQHVLELDFTQKTTQENTRLHELMAEFDEILLRSDDITDELHRLTSKLTLDSDIFIDFVKTRRGSLMVHVILGKTEEIDRVILEAIKQWFTEVTTDSYGHAIILRTIDVFKKRGNLKVHDQILRLIGVHALYLTKHIGRGIFLVHQAINLDDFDCTETIACGFQCHYINLSFLKDGSKIVVALLCNDKSESPLMLMVMEILECDDATLVRLANDKYGNIVLETTLGVAKERSDDLFGDLADKLKPLLDTLRGTQGENIAAMISDT